LAGEGFKYILDGMNAERILISSESIGDGRRFVERAASYSKTRIVFDRPIGANQGVQFPIARAHMAAEAVDLMRLKAANACMDTFGGYGFCQEYDIERKFRETRLHITAPVANNLVLAFIGQHVLGRPRSY
jgi:acyl-CoA dehydrogenase